MRKLVSIFALLAALSARAVEPLDVTQCAILDTPLGPAVVEGIASGINLYSGEPLNFDWRSQNRAQNLSSDYFLRVVRNHCRGQITVLPFMVVAAMRQMRHHADLAERIETIEQNIFWMEQIPFPPNPLERITGRVGNRPCPPPGHYGIEHANSEAQIWWRGFLQGVQLSYYVDLPWQTFPIVESQRLFGRLEKYCLPGKSLITASASLVDEHLAKLFDDSVTFEFALGVRLEKLRGRVKILQSSPSELAASLGDPRAVSVATEAIGAQFEALRRRLDLDGNPQDETQFRELVAEVNRALPTVGRMRESVISQRNVREWWQALVRAEENPEVQRQRAARLVDYLERARGRVMAYWRKSDEFVQLKSALKKISSEIKPVLLAVHQEFKRRAVFRRPGEEVRALDEHFWANQGRAVKAKLVNQDGWSVSDFVEGSLVDSAAIPHVPTGRITARLTFANGRSYDLEADTLGNLKLETTAEEYVIKMEFPPVALSRSDAVLVRKVSGYETDTRLTKLAMFSWHPHSFSISVVTPEGRDVLEDLFDRAAGDTSLTADGKAEVYRRLFELRPESETLGWFIDEWNDI